MQVSTMPTTGTNVVWRELIWPLLCVLLVSCAEHERLPTYQLGDAGTRATSIATCDNPSEGCPCDEPGRLVDCGEVRDRLGDYVTCTQGVRLCGDEGVWGACAGNLVKKSISASSTTSSLALGAPESCTALNPCDPYCRQIVDTGVAVTNLPEGLCSTATGIGICPLCGYSGPIGDVAYAELPSEWQRVPGTCSPADDRCPIDMVCVGTTCQTRAAPCASASQTCSVDLTLGKPCFDPAAPNSSYHIPLCNRGAAALTSGTIRIGVDSRSANVASCVPPTDPASSAGFPDSGSIEFELTDGRRISAGTCIDITPENSQQTGLDLTGNRTLLANFDGGIAECNVCNNGSVAILSSDSGVVSVCTTCVNLECSQTNPDTTLRGVVYGPGGRQPVPNAIVYVPNGPLAAFVDGVACDTCDALVSGSPIALTKTDATGHFTLTQVPSDTSLPLVVQLGRWRKQVRVAAIASGETRWVTSCSGSPAQCNLTSGVEEPPPASNPSDRLRLPSSQRWCSALNCAGEGDIPQMAVIMGDADPVQCVLRRIGIDDEEFTNSRNDGRVHLFRANGMWREYARLGFGDGGLVRDSLDPADYRLDAYSILLAPCDTSHTRIGGLEGYGQSAYGSGPSYNSWPDPALTVNQRTNVKKFVDAGGRLLTTHWQSVDLVRMNYGVPTRANFGSIGAEVPLISPFDRNADAAFSSAAAAFAGTLALGFDWQYQSPNDYDPTAPALYLFGNNVEVSGNASHSLLAAATASYPRLGYDIDTGTELGARFATWASTVGATDGGRLQWQSWSPMVHRVRADHGVVPLLLGDSRELSRFNALADPNATRTVPVAQQPCLQGDGTEYDCSTGRTWGDEHVAMFQFDTPLEASQKCGRVAVASGHASQHECFAPSNARSSGYCNNRRPYSATNPAPDCDCFEFPQQANVGCGPTLDMSAEELAFEFLLFSASQCIGELTSAPPAAILASNVYFRDFEANCVLREQAVWQLFSWQAGIPAGSRIDFYGATADSEEALKTAAFVKLGVADQTTATWTASNQTVDQAFREGLTPPDVSRRWLRLKAVFVPARGMSPTLSQWRVVFNCLPNE